MSKYLIVVDAQKDFVDGALGTTEAHAIIPRAKEKIAEYRANGALMMAYLLMAIANVRDLVKVICVRKVAKAQASADKEG